MNDCDEEDLEYFRAKIFAALTIPKDCGMTNKPIWRGDLDEDFYIARWGALDVLKVTKVFPDAIPTTLDEQDDRRVFFFKDGCGNRQFIIEDQAEDDEMVSHGSHILSPEQYCRLNNAGAEFY
jgi:hypothetical protein